MDQRGNHESLDRWKTRILYASEKESGCFLSQTSIWLVDCRKRWISVLDQRVVVKNRNGYVLRDFKPQCSRSRERGQCQEVS